MRAESALTGVSFLLTLCRPLAGDGAVPVYLLKMARGLGAMRRAGVARAGSFGAALSRYLLTQREEVFDGNPPDRSGRRRRGKSDPLDAQNATR
ncbi:hypothetical protein [Streptomyces decoyicus]|uniref:hypothetical protein n=1 Tax=Streptomyces decoyicus TaxID=249567 RepID=UPI00382008E3